VIGVSREIGELILVCMCRCITNKDRPEYLPQTELEGKNNIYEFYKETVQRIPDHPWLGTRNKNKEGKPYEWKKLREVDEAKEQFARGKNF
jgi:hypothetical protein